MYHWYGDMATTTAALLILTLLRLPLSQSYARAAAVLVDELDAGESKALRMTSSVARRG